MRPDQIGGKDVIDANAQFIGDVCDLEFDVSRWMVTHICVNLSDRAIEILGYQKPRFLGKVLVHLPVEDIQAVSDVVSLNKSIVEIKEFQAVSDVVSLNKSIVEIKEFIEQH
jgi:sporulation protein YlmC with PRC-barrel domain